MNLKYEISNFRFQTSHPLPLILATLLCSTLLFVACSRNEPSDSQEINVAAAANLTDAFEELGKQFTAQTGIRVRYSFGATADLARQIENGAPFDVFAAADTENVGRLSRQGLIVAGTDNIYARGRLVLWTPSGSTFKLERIEHILRPEIERIAIAKPDVAPYGRATIEALRSLNLWAQVESKVIYGQSVMQVKQYAATGNAEVAFLPRALVKPGEGHAIEIDESLHQPIDQTLAVIKDSKQQASAHRFTGYVLSPEGQALLERYGYGRAVTGDK